MRLLAVRTNKQSLGGSRGIYPRCVTANDRYNSKHDSVDLIDNFATSNHFLRVPLFDSSLACLILDLRWFITQHTIALE